MLHKHCLLKFKIPQFIFTSLQKDSLAGTWRHIKRTLGGPEYSVWFISTKSGHRRCDDYVVGRQPHVTTQPPYTRREPLQGRGPSTKAPTGNHNISAFFFIRLTARCVEKPVVSRRRCEGLSAAEYVG